MSSTSLSHSVKKTCDTLKQSAANQIIDYEQRFSCLKNLYDSLLRILIRTQFNPKTALVTAQSFFGSDAVRFAAIDGTLYSRPIFDMVIFFGGAYAATGTVKFSEKSIPKVEYDKKTIQQNMGISSIVPVYINEIPDVDHTFSAHEQPNEVNPAKMSTDEDVINNSFIANALMTFSEYYLAYKLAANDEEKTRIILLDRSLSTDHASLLYETRKFTFWKDKSSILGYRTKNEDASFDMNDLYISRQHIINQKLQLPPPRANYLRHAIINLAIERQSLTSTQLKSFFGILDEKRQQKVAAALNNLVRKQILNEKNGIFKINQKYVTSWERTKKLTTEIGDQLFSLEAKNCKTSTCMKILANDREQWLTTLDISFLTLFALQMLVEECWKRHILLLGVTKDTTARDFKRQLVPILHNRGLLENSLKSDALQKLPNTDRMILQSASMLNPDNLQPPWSLIEYDSAFRSAISDTRNGEDHLVGVIKNRINLEKVFLKTYLQLSQARSNNLLRSNVLLVDRLVYPEYDYSPENIQQFWNRLSDGSEEPLEMVLFKDRTACNKIQDLVMNLLIAMTPSNIPEAFGHNKPLFIADKIAKWNYSQAKRIVDTTATWMLNNQKLRKFIFYMSTFRERRTSIEATRREKS